MRHRSALAAGTVCVLTAAIYGCAREPAAPRPTPESSAEARAATLDLAVATILSGSSSLSTSVSDLSSGISTAVANLASGGTVIQAAVFAGGKSTCYVRDGEAECWGQNRTGQLGDGTTEDRSAPVPVTTAEGPIAALALGYTNACALMEAGDIVCWGSSVSVFLESGAQAAYRTVSVGASHACGVSAEGEVLCWGRNSLGALGDGTTENREEPVEAVGLAGGATAVAAGVDFSCAVHRGGVRCWGSNDNGQVGDGTYAVRLIPVDVIGLDSGFAGVTAGVFHACAWTNEGEAWCWGENLSGQLGDGTGYNSSHPVKVDGIAGGVSSVAAGGSHTCALTRAGGVMCWGNNDHGQLGDGTKDSRKAPVDVSGLTGGVIALAAGTGHTCALRKDGFVQCWGLNDHGQLGNGGTEESLVPVDVERR